MESAEAWMAAAEDSMREVSETALAMPMGAGPERRLAPPPHSAGAYIQIVSPQEMVQVGLCADAPTLARLAAALLGGDCELGAADVTDAVGEVVNMFAGGIKRRMVAERPGLQLGLPVFIQGHLEASSRQQLLVSELRLSSDLPITLVVLRERRSGR